MDIADQPEKIGLFLADNRLVPVLEKMAVTLVSEVVPCGISCQQFAHECRQAGSSALQQGICAWLVKSAQA